jgi:hypothetical protein
MTVYHLNLLWIVCQVALSGFGVFCSLEFNANEINGIILTYQCYKYVCYILSLHNREMLWLLSNISETLVCLYRLLVTSIKLHLKC